MKQKKKAGEDEEDLAFTIQGVACLELSLVAMEQPRGFTSEAKRRRPTIPWTIPFGMKKLPLFATHYVCTKHMRVPELFAQKRCGS
ncbi:hypothetical protein PV327_010241 [Microctonus hyperodae]|uniref:Uncharacterized protein n=1 Tax=Microctonus hyperodae TaxID=165561 RepID=A0AA39KUS8_MICHY|nr:hypothetical protein PV327_010241 [Microctonus hyperodae]